MYAIEGETPIASIVRAYDFKTGTLLGERLFTLDRAPGDTPIYYPAYAQLDGLMDIIHGATSDRLAIEIVPAVATQQLWGFISITNNDTQDITTVTPQ